MNLSSLGLLGSADKEAARKKLRYLGVSIASVPVGQGLIQGLGLWLDNYAAASALTAFIVTVPSFFILKYYVWRDSSGENLGGQMLGFWVVMMLAFSLATLFTYIVDHATNAQTPLIRGTAVFCAQLFAFGVVWVGRYIVFDRWLFKHPPDNPDAMPPTKAQGRPHLWWLNRPAAAPSGPSQEAHHPADAVARLIHRKS
jgi:putative flippase GtrA